MSAPAYNIEFIKPNGDAVIVGQALEESTANLNMQYHGLKGVLQSSLRVVPADAIDPTIPSGWLTTYAIALAAETVGEGNMKTDRTHISYPQVSATVFINGFDGFMYYRAEDLRKHGPDGVAQKALDAREKARYG